MVISSETLENTLIYEKNKMLQESQLRRDLVASGGWGLCLCMSDISLSLPQRSHFVWLLNCQI